MEFLNDIDIVNSISDNIEDIKSLYGIQHIYECETVDELYTYTKNILYIDEFIKGFFDIIHEYNNDIEDLCDDEVNELFMKRIYDSYIKPAYLKNTYNNQYIQFNDYEYIIKTDDRIASFVTIRLKATYSCIYLRLNFSGRREKSIKLYDITSKDNELNYLKYAILESIYGIGSDDEFFFFDYIKNNISKLENIDDILVDFSDVPNYVYKLSKGLIESCLSQCPSIINFDEYIKILKKYSGKSGDEFKDILIKFLCISINRYPSLFIYTSNTTKYTYKDIIICTNFSNIFRDIVMEKSYGLTFVEVIENYNHYINLIH